MNHLQTCDQTMLQNCTFQRLRDHKKGFKKCNLQLEVPSTARQFAGFYKKSSKDASNVASDLIFVSKIDEHSKLTVEDSERFVRSLFGFPLPSRIIPGIAKKCDPTLTDRKKLRDNGFTFTEFVITPSHVIRNFQKFWLTNKKFCKSKKKNRFSIFCCCCFSIIQQR